jgi:hypothetical protein
VNNDVLVMLDNIFVIEILVFSAEFGGDWCTSFLFACKHCCTCNLITREHSFVARRGSSIACAVLHEGRRLVPDSGFPPRASTVCRRSTQLRCPSSLCASPLESAVCLPPLVDEGKLATVFNYDLYRLVNCDYCFLDLHFSGCRKNPSALGG